jgi:hypothetical protein
MLLLSLLQAACLLQLPLLLGYLEAVNLDQILLDEALLRQELQHILALVALQLDDLHAYTGGRQHGTHFQSRVTSTTLTQITSHADTMNTSADAKGLLPGKRCKQLCAHLAELRVIHNGTVAAELCKGNHSRSGR